MALTFRRAVLADTEVLGRMNHELIQDEGHRNPMTVPQLLERMRGWLSGEYTAVLFENETGVVAYALYREEAELIYLRQLFVARGERRKGHGLEAIRILRGKVWPAGKRLTVDVLTANAPAISFWKKAGFREYCLTLESLPETK